ncbi:hypothetical protein BVZ65_01439 [Haemophilus influenzae]|nr:hypothetical protein BVZ65_01439 [Haemophilus influenzae]
MTTKTTAKISINVNVNSLEVESHINKLCSGCELEGITNGNIDTAAVIITPAIVNAEKKNAKPQRFALENAAFNNAATTANAGKIQRIGISLKFLNHAPVSTATSLFIGDDGAK